MRGWVMEAGHPARGSLTGGPPGRPTVPDLSCGKLGTAMLLLLLLLRLPRRMTTPLATTLTRTLNMFTLLVLFLWLFNVALPAP